MNTVNCMFMFYLSDPSHQTFVQFFDLGCHDLVVDPVAAGDLGQSSVELLHVGFSFPLFLLHFLEQFLHGLSYLT